MIKKLIQLKENLQQYDSMAIAFSGGVDSTFLLKIAHDVLGDRVTAFTIKTNAVPQKELEEAVEFCIKEKIKHCIIEVDAMEVDGFKENSPERCYFCKKALFNKMLQEVSRQGIHAIAEGSNMDDLSDYRPGHRAIVELHVVSPLRDAKLYKEEIRQLSKEEGIPTWDKPSYACLASRIPYGEQITNEKLYMVEQAEEYLKNLGFSQFRVRVHGEIARIEVLPTEFEMLLSERESILSAFTKYGFSYISMDLQGYRTGSMNEIL